MLKYVKHHLENIAGVEVWPVLSFILFFLFFMGVLWWVFTARRAHLDRMARLPLSDATRRAATVALLLVAMPAMAQQAPAVPQTTPLVEVTPMVNMVMLALAVVQVIFILSLAGIMRTFIGNGAWLKKLGGRGGKAMVLLPFFLLLSGSARAQAYAGGGSDLSAQQYFWVLVGVNVMLFIILMVQVNLLRGFTRMVTGEVERPVKTVDAPDWTARLMARLTRRPTEEKEQDLLMHHEYDGIRELDNVLPPWWLWLFYGTVAWGLIYLFNVHVINVWPKQHEAYVAEMRQADADIAAFVARQGNLVDETNVMASTDAGVLRNGEALFTQYCVACHSAGAQGSATSVGPNLTDPYWIHGGGVKNIFKTIKYGVPAKGMISWKAQLKPAEMAALTSYILSRDGKGDASQKTAQGDLWKEAPLPADTAALPADSVLSDTVRFAAR